MFSLENFYYILYTNLFKPARIKVNYFYPFGYVGPQHNVEISSMLSGRAGDPSLSHQAIFYDQEPILLENFKALDNVYNYYASNIRHANFFVNSEYSDLKSKICRENKFLDLYYFFHGFAALIWYRDYKYLPVNYQVKKHYISLNRLFTNDRSYRLNIVSNLIDRDILGKGMVSLHLNDTSYGTWRDELESTESKLSIDAKSHIYQNLSKLDQSLIVDTATPIGSLSAAVGPMEHMTFQSALWHLVTETVFYYPKLHLTEKIFRPIVNKRPFILAAAPGNLAYLKRYGFKTFDTWIDESYDQEQDNDKRILLITNELEKICRLSIEDIRKMQRDMQETLDYNFNHFYGNFKHIIVDELLSNYKTSMIQWNNQWSIDRMFDIDEVNFKEIKKILVS